MIFRSLKNQKTSKTNNPKKTKPMNSKRTNRKNNNATQNSKIITKNQKKTTEYKRLELKVRSQ